MEELMEMRIHYILTISISHQKQITLSQWDYSLFSDRRKDWWRHISCRSTGLADDWSTDTFLHSSRFRRHHHRYQGTNSHNPRNFHQTSSRQSLPSSVRSIANISQSQCRRWTGFLPQSGLKPSEPIQISRCKLLVSIMSTFISPHYSGNGPLHPAMFFPRWSTCNIYRTVLPKLQGKLK